MARGMKVGLVNRRIIFDHQQRFQERCARSFHVPQRWAGIRSAFRARASGKKFNNAQRKGHGKTMGPLTNLPPITMKTRFYAFGVASFLLVAYLLVHFSSEYRSTPIDLNRLGKTLLDLASPNASCPPAVCPPDQICLPKAPYLSPTELMKRPVPPLGPINGSIPKLIHQSWSSKELPEHFLKWSDTWRMQHPDWEWVLWTNEDNHALVDSHFPWFKDMFERMDREILRADAARNMYMYIFGGYAGAFLWLTVEYMQTWTSNASARSTDYLLPTTPQAYPTLSSLRSTRWHILVEWDRIRHLRTRFRTPGWPRLPFILSFFSPSKQLPTGRTTRSRRWLGQLHSVTRFSGIKTNTIMEPSWSRTCDKRKWIMCILTSTNCYIRFTFSRPISFILFHGMNQNGFRRVSRIIAMAATRTSTALSARRSSRFGRKARIASRSGRIHGGNL